MIEQKLFRIPTGARLTRMSWLITQYRWGVELATVLRTNPDRESQ